MDFPYNENSRLWDILDAHPWLLDVLPEYDERLSMLKKPAMRLMTKKYTVADVTKYTGYTVEKLLDKLERLIREHEE